MRVLQVRPRRGRKFPPGLGDAVGSITGLEQRPWSPKRRACGGGVPVRNAYGHALAVISFDLDKVQGDQTTNLRSTWPGISPKGKFGPCTSAGNPVVGCSAARHGAADEFLFYSPRFNENPKSRLSLGEAAAHRRMIAPGRKRKILSAFLARDGLDTNWRNTEQFLDRGRTVPFFICRKKRAREKGRNQGTLYSVAEPFVHIGSARPLKIRTKLKRDQFPRPLPSDRFQMRWKKGLEQSGGISKIRLPASLSG